MLKFIIAPIVGGIIGYITNDLAIKMLFHPRRAVYIGKFHIPFTPGLIPQQKKRVAASIGRVISKQLLNAATLQETLLSPEILERIRAGVISAAEGFADDRRSVREVLYSYANREKIDHYEQVLTQKAALFLADKLAQARVGSSIVGTALQNLRSALGAAGALLDDNFIDSIGVAVGGKLDDMIRENGPALLEKELGHVCAAALEQPVCEIYAANRERLPGAAEKVAQIYESVLSSHLDKVLSAVDIEQIVVKKVSSFKAEQLETMIFGIMKRELKAIVYLGAALGFLMGFINLLF